MINYEQLQKILKQQRDSIEKALEAEAVDKEAILNAHEEAVKQFDTFSRDSYEKVKANKKRYEEMLKDAGYDPESGKSLKDYMREIEAKASKAADGDKYQSQIDLLNSKLEKTAEELSTWKTKAEQASEEKKRSELLGNLTEKLKAGGLDEFMAKTVAENRVVKGEVDLVEGEPIYKVGDKTLPLEDGVNAFLESDEGKGLIVSKQKTGGGTEPPKGDSAGDDEYEKMLQIAQRG